MKIYKTVFVIVPDSEKKTVQLSAFAVKNYQDVLVMGFSQFNFDVRKMLRSDIVVTVGDWHSCENCIKAVQVARIMNLTVIHETNFKNYVEQSND